MEAKIVFFLLCFFLWNGDKLKRLNTQNKELSKSIMVQRNLGNAIQQLK